MQENHSRPWRARLSMTCLMFRYDGTEAELLLVSKSHLAIRGIMPGDRCNVLGVGFCEAKCPAKILICWVTLAFEELLEGSIAYAQVLSQSLVGSRHAVALLCPSSIDFLLAWLGLMRLGRRVLLIAYVLPQEILIEVNGRLQASMPAFGNCPFMQILCC